MRNLGIGDAWDVISGIDYLVAQGIADNDKVGTMGWSQGGYISAFLTTHDSARFKAVSVGAGISNWMTYYVNTDIHPFTRQYLKATPWDDPKIYADTSPMTYIKKAKAPTLIQHGELDKRVPIPNAYELYQGLQDQGVPAKLIVYKGFGHGLTKPKAHRAAMEHNLEWFGKYIWGETPAPAPASASARHAACGEQSDAVSRRHQLREDRRRLRVRRRHQARGGGGAEEAGYASVVNFRPATEAGANVEQEKAAVEAAGLKYIHIPFTRTDPDVQPAIDAFLAAAKDAANRPMLFHCASGNRAAAMWAFKRVYVDGWPADKALSEAEAVGLTQAPMKTWAADYLKAHPKRAFSTTGPRTSASSSDWRRGTPGLGACDTRCAVPFTTWRSHESCRGAWSGGVGAHGGGVCPAVAQPPGRSGRRLAEARLQLDSLQHLGGRRADAAGATCGSRSRPIYARHGIEFIAGPGGRDPPGGPRRSSRIRSSSSSPPCPGGRARARRSATTSSSTPRARS